MPGAESSAGSGADHQALDPEDHRFMPLGLTLSEAYVLFHGLCLGQRKESPSRVLRSPTLTVRSQRFYI